MIVAFIGVAMLIVGVVMTILTVAVFWPIIIIVPVLWLLHAWATKGRRANKAANRQADFDMHMRILEAQTQERIRDARERSRAMYGSGSPACAHSLTGCPGGCKSTSLD